jgi:hypothetical protein
MKIESPQFTERELRAFYEEVLVWEDGHGGNRPTDPTSLIRRLETASERIEELVAQIPEGPSEGDPEHPRWNAREVLGHIVGLSRLYGSIARRIVREGQTEIDLVAIVRHRDPSAAELAKLPVEELLATTRAAHAETIAFLHSTAPEDLCRRAKVGPFDMSAEEVVRLVLCAHLEMHNEQLEQALRT